MISVEVSLGLITIRTRFIHWNFSNKDRSVPVLKFLGNVARKLFDYKSSHRRDVSWKNRRNG